MLLRASAGRRSSPRTGNVKIIIAAIASGLAARLQFSVGSDASATCQTSIIVETISAVKVVAVDDDVPVVLWQQQLPRT